MPHDPASPSTWLAYAKSDLAMARLPIGPPVLPENLCFHAQQAAEKAINAVLIKFGIEPPKIHDIRRLTEHLPDGVTRPEALTASAPLTDYATLTRYPWAGEPVSEEDHRDALRLAKAVVAWAENVIGFASDA